MKNISTLLFTIIIIPGVYAQQPIRVYEDSITYSKQ